MEIIADKPIEVTEKRYGILMHQCAGVIAGRKSENKFYIKVWMMKYKSFVQDIIEKVK
jgi:hypothetical protein